MKFKQTKIDDSFDRIIVRNVINIFESVRQSKVIVKNVPSYSSMSQMVPDETNEFAYLTCRIKYVLV